MSDYNWKTLEETAYKPLWITDEAELARCCEHWRSLPLVALDTEFMRVETFYPVAGLIQVADDQRCYLIDPLAIEDYSALIALFQDPAVIKVMHACTEDLELFLKLLGVLPQPLFDTQIAAAVLNWGFSMGLQRMLEQTLEVRIAKHETTSDWLRRPLSGSQERYAALDVAYLPAIYEIQSQALEQREISHWAAQENQALLDNACTDDPQGLDYYQRFTQMWRYPEHKLAALRDLTAWREQVARTRDVPRNRILRNQGLLQIIDRWPRSKMELSRLDEVKKKILRTDGETILAFLANSQESAKENPPQPIPGPLHYCWNKHLKRLKAIVRNIAEAENIAPEILFRRKEMEQLIRSGLDDGEYAMPEDVAPWRQALVGPPLLAELERIEQTKNESEGA